MSGFMCTECGSHLRMHESFRDISLGKATTTGKDSFIVLPETFGAGAKGSKSGGGTSQSAKLKTTERLLNLASTVEQFEFGDATTDALVLGRGRGSGELLADDNAQPSHPLCSACADELQLRLESRVAEARKERDAYVAYLQSLDENTATATVIKALSLEEAQKQEQEAIAEYEQLEREAAKVRADLEAAQQEMKELDELEAQYWQDVNKLQQESREIEMERDSYLLKHATAVRQLERLEKTNVYNDAFRIWHDGPFGTINGFRLGRLPSQPVEWDEINAALGQALLLLDILATKLGFIFEGYKLVPMGSFSRIEKTTDDKTAYELYGSSNFASLLYWNKRFDHGLVAFLNCIQQLGDYVQQRDAKLKLPYGIHKDKIGDISVKVPQFGGQSDEEWTKGLKYVLVNLRWLLVYCVSSSSSSSK
ncbi:APG6-domain-containing protein [Rhizoclosmatium globosum]|uniref:APG6-domain-containing protein n=1 Tax=Rhizoclosmatium globosum TaxID=329046 RepID=A0A1Y2BZ20_9FUNG|nr:APG6-domain-containing protein [Rhizoclosmatium globosum]|eukprot:ORY40001.1 APG6-domain-containing protein [Rhizoclosmatium globosum]